MRTFTLSELMSEGPDTGKVINEDGPMLSLDARNKISRIIEPVLRRIETGIRRRERAIEDSFNRSSYRYWEDSPHRCLSHSLDYLYHQLRDLRNFVKQGSPTGILGVVRLLPENAAFSFREVDAALKEPLYNYRDEQQKAQARQHYIKAWSARQLEKERNPDLRN
jgi:hypothetical protein